MFVVYVHVSLYTPLGWSIVLRPDKPAWVVLVAYVVLMALCGPHLSTLLHHDMHGM